MMVHCDIWLLTILRTKQEDRLCKYRNSEIIKNIVDML